MELFKEINCTVCGKKTKMLSRIKLADGNYVCADCQAHSPHYMYESITGNYTLTDYKKFLEYIEYSSNVLRPIFHETHKYYSLHIDTENNLFYIGNYIDKNTLFLQLCNIIDFDLVFSPEKIKEGLIGDKVQGKVLFKIKMQDPYFYYEEILDYSAKAKAKKTFFGSNIQYENPKGMDDFMLYLRSALMSCINESHSNNKTSVDAEPIQDELHKAMALFMLDDLNHITLKTLKEQRNKLMKTFHPDKATEDDTKYAQKINNAYEILKQYAEE